MTNQIETDSDCCSLSSVWLCLTPPWDTRSFGMKTSSLSTKLPKGSLKGSRIILVNMFVTIRRPKYPNRCASWESYLSSSVSTSWESSQIPEFNLVNSLVKKTITTGGSSIAIISLIFYGVPCFRMFIIAAAYANLRAMENFTLFSS